MRTWESICDEVLGLMFSNNTGSSKVTTEDASVAEYMFNMHHAFNSGIDDLYANVIECKDFVDVEAMAGDFVKVKDKLENNNKYISLCDEVYRYDTATGKYKKTVLYDLISNDIIVLEKDGNYKVGINVKPVIVDENTEASALIEIPDGVISALVYYMAYRLYLEDDASVATSYLNIYEAKKEALAELHTNKGGSTGQTFESVRGWY